MGVKLVTYGIIDTLYPLKFNFRARCPPSDGSDIDGKGPAINSRLQESDASHSFEFAKLPPAG